LFWGGDAFKKTWAGYEARSRETSGSGVGLYRAGRMMNEGSGDIFCETKVFFLKIIKYI
jgi:signal transduction histidine kinase